MKVNFVKMHENAQVPMRNKEDDGAAGYDVKAGESHILYPNETYAVGTGIKCALPEGTFAMIVSRSGLSLKGIIVNNAPGIIDSTYRGEWKVILHNQSNRIFNINIGDRIAQCLLMNYNTINFTEVEELDSTERGEKGFGSSGI